MGPVFLHDHTRSSTQFWRTGVEIYRRLGRLNLESCDRSGPVLSSQRENISELCSVGGTDCDPPLAV